MNYQEATQKIMDFMVKDYVRWSSGKDMPVPSYELQAGRNYDKIIMIDGYRGSKTVAGFICAKDNPKKGFKVGDMLMAAGWNGPATNFTRGNIFEGNAVERVRWTGIL